MSDSREFKIVVEDVKFRYDSSTDILYIDFMPEFEEAEETILIGDNVILRIKDGRLLGLTVMEFTKLLGGEMGIREL